MKRARETEREVFKVLKIVIANRQDRRASITIILGQLI